MSSSRRGPNGVSTHHAPTAVATDGQGLTSGVAYLRSARAIRERCGNILDAVRAGRSTFFRVDESKLEDAARVVERVTLERYPDLKVPFHSRWRHFSAGGLDRAGQLDQALGSASAAECARARIDLAFISVLLDAGAGAAWRYVEPGTKRIYTRSEGLGVASFHAFMRGDFSARPEKPLQVDADALARIDTNSLAAMFQMRDDNPLVGVEGRVTLLRGLGLALRAQPSLFGIAPRPGHLFDALTEQGSRHALGAEEILAALLEALAPIWPSDRKLAGESLGDVWRHPLAGGQRTSAGWVPFHKLSQWLTYSLLEPFQWGGIDIDGIDQLTALAEYRNGGLLVDTGVIVPTDPTLKQQTHRPGSLPIIEWRALTVALMDPLAERVRQLLGRDAAAMPLIAVLEGGSWAAGRELARLLRGGEPPFKVISDGTVF